MKSFLLQLGRVFRIACLASASFSWPAPLAAETVYQWTNLAGQPGGPGSNDGIGTSASFYNPSGIAVDAAGNKFVADSYNQTIRKITPSGVVTTCAGSAGLAGSADGAGTMARFQNPNRVAVDANGNLYVADTGNHTIRKITPSGVVTTLAGSAALSGSADGSGSTARFSYPNGLALDAEGNLYVADSQNHTIRKLTPSGVVTTLAGQAGTQGSTDGTGGNARFAYPCGVTVDSNNELYVADQSNRTIRKVTTSGIVTTIAGSPGSSGSTDGTGSVARFSAPTDVAVDTAGNLYVADTYNRTIRKVTSSGVVTTLAGAAGASGSADGTGGAARFGIPSGLAVDPSGNVFVADQIGTIRMVTSTGDVTTIAGSAGSSGAADGSSSMARFYQPSEIAVDTAGNAYIADRANSVIRKVTSAGIVTTLAGSAGQAGSLDGTGNTAHFKYPRGIAVDISGNVYVADTENFTIRKVTPAGVVTTLAGSAGVSGAADGTASNARFNYSTGLAVDASGNIYVADANSRTIRKVTPAGDVTTLAGSAGTIGSIDGTGNAARFGYPVGVAVDGGGNAYVADASNHTIRKVTASGVVTTLAGSPGISGSLDGVGNVARFYQPYGVVVDSSGNVFVADSSNHSIRKVTPGGGVTTIGGIPGRPGSADGLGQSALFRFPWSVAIGPSDKLLIADSGNNRISVGTPAGSPPIVSLGSVSPISATTATLNGKVNPNGLATSVVFEYGDSPLYGINVATVISPDADTLVHDVSAALTGLTLNALYYYRLTATNADGTASTAGGTFVTMVPPTISSEALATIPRKSPFSYAIIADQGPSLYTATGLPSGLTLDPNTGIISGAATQEGIFEIPIGATNAAGSSSATLVLTVTLSDPNDPNSWRDDLLISQPSSHSILRFDPLTGEPRGAFIPSETGGLDSPQEMTIGPDGNLYVADSTMNTVKKFSILDGAFIEDFTESGYLIQPVALKFGPDGKLYVLCGGNNRKLFSFDGTTGDYEALLIDATPSQLDDAKDFLFMPSTNDFLITSRRNAVSRFNFTTGAFVSYYLNSTRSSSILDSPTGIIIGPDSNYWVASSNGFNKITRFSITDGGKIDDVFMGSNHNFGHQQMQYENGYIYVANGLENNVVVYDATVIDYSSKPMAIPSKDITVKSTGDAFEFITAESQALTNPKHLLFLDINDPPSANAGVDQAATPGQIITLTGTGTDRETAALAYTWTQLSGTPVLSGSLLASGSVSSPSLGFIVPDSGSPLVFQLTVSDGVNSANDTVSVTINGAAVGTVPVLTLQAATGVTTQSATLHGMVNPVAGSAAWRFDYGTVVLDRTTDVQTVSSAQAVSAVLTGLLPGQTYFYRLVATNGYGGQFTSEGNFTTLFDEREIIVESPPSPELSNGNGELDLGKVIDGRSGTARIITIRNGGGTDLILGQITKDGTEAGDFAVSSPALSTLAAGESEDFTVIFTPGALGVRTAAIHIPSNDADEASFDIALTGTGVTPAEAWRFQNFTTIHNIGPSADLADPDKDGLVNLLERAFKLNPNQPALPILITATGTTGLPNIRSTGTDDDRRLVIEYIRLRASTNPGLTYTPQFLSDLGATWQDFTGTETTESIDTEWERVTVEDTTTGETKRFGRVKVVSGE